MTRGMGTLFGPVGSLLCRAGLVLSVGSAAGCLVTDEINYDRPNTPPQVTKLKPLGFRTVPPFPEPECSPQGTGARVPWMNFPISVRDIDVDDKLQFRLMVNGRSVRTGRIPLTGKAERDAQTYCIERRFLGEPCLHVEILISSEFADPDGQTDPYAPFEPNDLGYAEWWVLGLAADYPEVGPGSCDPMLQGGT